jgi:hypothetical protein
MTLVGARRRRPFLCALLFAVALPVEGRAQLFHVCAFGFNSHDELAAFRAELPAEEFDFTDFSAQLVEAQLGTEEQRASSGQNPNDAPLSQLLALCRSDLRCDISIYSGEFAGEFFGRYGSSLSLPALEEAACQPRCQGLFHAAQEVFLLACNTLASKDRDQRTPQQYLQVLLDHGFDRAAAERVVQLRYGPWGPSFREAILRVFAGAPRIYGFSSVAPNGAEVAGRLRRYFRSVGDYGRYLDAARARTAPNLRLLAAFRGTSLTQMSGIPESEQQAAERALLCGVYDDSRTLEQRLQVVRQLLLRNDFLSFLPTIERFFRLHPPERFGNGARRLLTEMHADVAVRDRVVDLVHVLHASALQLELANLARYLGWISGDAFRQVTVDAARQLLAPPVSSEVVDVLCESSARQSIGDQFRSADLPDGLFRDAQGLRLVACLSPPDARISQRLVAGLDSPDAWARRWAAYALSRRLPLQDAVLKQLADHLDDPSTDVQERLRWLFRAQRPLPDDIRAAIAVRDPLLAEDLHPPALPP